MTTPPPPMVGRQAVYGNVLSTVTAITEYGHIVLAYDAPKAHHHHEVVLLPDMAEKVRLPLPGQDEPVTVMWLNVVTVNVGSVTARFLHGSTVRTETIPLGNLTLPETRYEPPTPAERNAALALIRAQDEEQRVQAWKQQLTKEAHDYADIHDLCEQFDDFMQAHGLDRRQHCWTVLAVFEDHLPLTVMAATADEARRKVTPDLIAEHIAANPSTYTIEVEE